MQSYRIFVYMYSWSYTLQQLKPTNLNPNCHPIAQTHNIYQTQQQLHLSTTKNPKKIRPVDPHRQQAQPKRHTKPIKKTKATFVNQNRATSNTFTRGGHITFFFLLPPPLPPLWFLLFCICNIAIY